MLLFDHDTDRSADLSIWTMRYYYLGLKHKRTMPLAGFNSRRDKKQCVYKIRGDLDTKKTSDCGPLSQCFFMATTKEHQPQNNAS